MPIHPEMIEQPELDISVVIPIYNEEGNLERLYTEITAALEEIGRSYSQL